MPEGPASSAATADVDSGQSAATLIDHLERLSALHATGALDSTEFAEAKKLLLAGAQTAAETPASPPTEDEVQPLEPETPASPPAEGEVQPLEPETMRRDRPKVKWVDPYRSNADILYCVTVADVSSELGLEAKYGLPLCCCLCTVSPNWVGPWWLAAPCLIKWQTAVWVALEKHPDVGPGGMESPPVWWKQCLWFTFCTPCAIAAVHKTAKPYFPKRAPKTGGDGGGGGGWSPPPPQQQSWQCRPDPDEWRRDAEHTNHYGEHGDGG